MSVRPLNFGETPPHLKLDSNRNPSFATSSLGGQYLLVLVITDVTRTDAQAALKALAMLKLEERNRLACALCCDEKAKADATVQAAAQTRLIFYDSTRRAYDAWGLANHPDGMADRCILFDPMLRVLSMWPLERHEEAMASLTSAVPPDMHAGTAIHAPVLLVPRVFEPAFCLTLIEAYEKAGGQPSGTTRENEEGKTYVALDDGFKRRADVMLTDETLRRAAMQRIYWRLLPQLEKAFTVKMTRMERYIVACYEAGSGGFFKPHRDNTTKGTAHRRFAITINLNAEDYEGGDLRFPEFGSHSYRAPTGGAVIFSCSLLHEALPVTRGKRYAFLPFLYDEDAAALREQNSAFLDESLPSYRARTKE